MANSIKSLLKELEKMGALKSVPVTPENIAKYGRVHYAPAKGKAERHPDYVHIEAASTYGAGRKRKGGR